jgi:ribosomal protein S18 acetylase RimI-like enzyme
MIQKIDPPSALTDTQQADIVSFLATHLEQFGDHPKDIQKCLDYAMDPNRGGHVYLARAEDQTLQGVCVVLNTHMMGFIPPHILVYIAVDGSLRGQGIGKKLITYVQNDLKEGIALHVEPDNPARRLYDRLGFTHRYLEMRWTPDGLS